MGDVVTRKEKKTGFFTTKMLERQKDVVAYIREGDVVLQSDIIHHFSKKWFNKPATTTIRIKVAYVLRTLERTNVITKERVTRSDRILPVNRWMIADDTARVQ
jgi:hypothetical protein